MFSVSNQCGGGGFPFNSCLFTWKPQPVSRNTSTYQQYMVMGKSVIYWFEEKATDKKIWNICGAVQASILHAIKTATHKTMPV